MIAERLQDVGIGRRSPLQDREVKRQEAGPTWTGGS